MRQLTSALVIGTLALLMGGCATSEDEQAVVSPVPSASPSTAAVATPKAQPFSSPVVAQSPRASTAASSLTQSTNPDERVRQVQQGRQDPFALLPIPPVPVAPANTNGAPAAPRTVPQVRSVPRPNNASSPTRTASRPTRGSGTTASGGRGPASGSGAATNRSNPRQTGRSTGTTNRPGNRPGTSTAASLPPIAALPPLPEPALAAAVEVSGVIQVGNEPQAIVKAPNETTSRYVRVGQRLANGQVLVKRIEMNEGSEPVVVFEQYGIEVSRAVGERPPQQDAGTPTAALNKRQWFG